MHGIAVPLAAAARMCSHWGGISLAGATWVHRMVVRSRSGVPLSPWVSRGLVSLRAAAMAWEGACGALEAEPYGRDPDEGRGGGASDDAEISAGSGSLYSESRSKRAEAVVAARVVKEGHSLIRSLLGRRGVDMSPVQGRAGHNSIAPAATGRHGHGSGSGSGSGA